MTPADQILLERIRAGLPVDNAAAQQLAYLGLVAFDRQTRTWRVLEKPNA